MMRTSRYITFLVVMTLAAFLTGCPNNKNVKEDIEQALNEGNDENRSSSNSSDSDTASTSGESDPTDGNSDAFVGEIPAITQQGSFSGNKESVSHYDSGQASTNESLIVTLDENDVFKSVSISTPSGTIKWDVEAGAIEEDFGVPEAQVSRLLQKSPDGISQSLMSIDEDLVGMQYQTFGVWAIGDDLIDGDIAKESIDVGAVSTGLATPASAVPTSGNATYAGKTIARLGSTAHGLYTMTSDLSVGIDFAARTGTFDAVNTHSVVSGNAAPDLDLVGTLSNFDGGTFTGEISTVTGGRTGITTGRFYGPGAEELGGVFSLTHNNPDKSDRGYIGAYGAVMQP